LVFIASLQYYGVRTNAGWLRIRITCPSAATVVSVS
jgi:hypothetical protein